MRDTLGQILRLRKKSWFWMHLFRCSKRMARLTRIHESHSGLLHVQGMGKSQAKETPFAMKENMKA